MRISSQDPSSYEAVEGVRGFRQQSFAMILYVPGPNFSSSALALNSQKSLLVGAKAGIVVCLFVATYFCYHGSFNGLG